MLMLKKNYWCYLIVGILFWLPIGLKANTNPVFYNINNLYGISMRETNSVIKDSVGFVWASSKTGILRLTDDDYKLYQLQYKYPNVMTVKLAFEGSCLLAYTNNGQVYKYDQISDSFNLLVDIKQELNDVFIGINEILVKDESVFWIATTNGLIKYDNRDLFRIESSANCPVFFSEDIILYVRNEELVSLDVKTLSSKLLFDSSIIPPLGISALYIDKTEQSIWIGTTKSGLFRYNLLSGKLDEPYNNIVPKQPILALESVFDNSLLIGIDGQGIWEVDKKKQQLLNIYKENDDNTSSLQGNGVYDLFCDDDKRVWVCTYSGGVSYFELSSPLVASITHQVNNPNSLANNNVNSILEDSFNNIWFATNNGISCWNPENNDWRNFYVDNQEQAQVFLTICEDNEGQIWAGTYSSGVYVIDAESGKELAHYSNQEKDSPFVNDFVFDIYKDNKGDIWIGGINSEVVCYHSKEKRFQKYPPQALYSFAEVSDSQMLFGCVHGLVLSDNITGNSQILKDGLITLDLLVQDSVVWLATSGFGLVKYNLQNDSVEKFTTQNGLPSNYISSISSAGKYLWLGTENGLCRFDPVSFSVVVYSSIESLSKVSFNRNAHDQLKNGNLAFGTNKGAIIFNHNNLQELHADGEIFIQDFRISGRSIRDLPEFNLNTSINNINDIELKYHQNTVSIELVPLGVRSGSKFSWKLDGFDNDWSEPIDLRQITYNNIPSKEYDLQIRLYDNSLSHILAERKIYFEVTPPFWATWWFLVVMFLIISFIIFGAFYYFLNQLNQKHTVEKIRFFTNTAHDLRTSITLIKAPIEELNTETNLTEDGRGYLKLAIEQTRRLSSVVNQLMDFQKADIGKDKLILTNVDIVKLIKQRYSMFEPLAQNKEIHVIFNANVKSYVSAIDESLIEKVIDNLVSNAIKYSHPNTQIIIQFNGTENKWNLEVQDNGIGIEKKEQRRLFREFYRAENAINAKVVGSGIGLLLIKNYVQLHGGEVGFKSQENVGSIFHITLPYKEVKEGILNKDLSLKVTENYIDTPIENSTKHVVVKTENSFRILIVEDNEELRNFIEKVLSVDFEVVTAINGSDAWDIVSKKEPDIVISDVMMPGKDGFELCHLIKSTYETSHIPIILLTALTGKAEQLHGIGLGADDYLTKPFDIEILRLKLKTIIQNRELIREKALKLIKVSDEGPILKNELNNQFLKEMLQVVHENMDNTKFGKEMFASAMNVSTSLLYKKVKALTNLSPSDFIKTVRLNHSIELLQSGKYNVSEVSDYCGFGSLRYFSVVFKSHFGKSPSEILK